MPPLMSDQERATHNIRLTEISLEQGEIKKRAELAGRNILASEARKLTALAGEESTLRDALAKDDEGQAAIAGVPISRSVKVGEEERTYRPDGPHSFFRDLVMRTQDANSEVRMRRHLQEVGTEQRAMSTASGSGVGLVPPQYLQDQLAGFARAGRVVANRMRSLPLPDVGMSFNVPRVTTGTTTAVQVSEAGAVQDNTPVTDDITLAVNTVAGKVDVSRQLFDRSSPNVDQILAADLSLDWNQKMDVQVIAQATNGVINLSGTNAITLSTATLAAAYPKFADAAQQVAANRFAPADSIVMHPRRWAWITAALDSQSRPFVVPDASGPANSLAVVGPPTSEGSAGSLQGYPVYLDANIPTNLGAGTNQDVVLVCRFDDALLFEDAAGPTVAVYEGVLSANLQVRILCFGYFAFTFARYPKANSIISGAGLVTPTF
jgi:HK97 family phage major capsid protein